MPRTFFRKVKAGHVTVSGVVVSKIQAALNAVSGQAIQVDSIFGSQTRDQLKTYQASSALSVTGEMDEVTWRRLMHTSEPTMFERALQVTAHFEGTGFTRVVGNFDGAGLTWGIIGFTLSNGELGDLLVDISKAQPALFNKAFGSDSAVILAKVALPQAERIAWANTVSRGPRSMDVAEPWRTYFSDLGSFPEIQEMQTKRAKERYWTIAVRDVALFDLGDERDYALFYDIAVQNGGCKSKGREKKIRDRFATSPVQNEDRLRDIVIDVIAETSTVKWQSDVRQRKNAINSGEGFVHGGNYLLTDWGVQSEVIPKILT